MSLTLYLYPPDATDATEPIVQFNYTHNIIPMAELADLYRPLWRGDDMGIETSMELAPFLVLMRADPDKYRALNPHDGWGSYDSFVRWLEKVYFACLDNPDAMVQVSR